MPVRRWLLSGLALASLTASAQPAFRWEPVPGALDAVPAGEPIEAAGFPVRLQAVRTSKGFEELLAHFARSFVRGGLYVAPFDKQAQGFRQVRLTGLDTKSQVAYTVFFQLNPDRSTTVVMSEAGLKERRGGEPPFAPVFPGGQSPVVSRVEGSRSLIYSVAGAGPEQIEGFYREVLSSSGYAEEAPGSYSRQGEQLELIVRRVRTGASVLVISRPASADGER